MASAVYFEMILLLLLCTSMLPINIEATDKLLFVFGDSLYDVGNNQYYNPTEFIVANHHPYGMAFLTATGRFSDGLLVPDFIAQYEHMPLIPPALDPDANGTFGYNFASAGGGVFNNKNSMNMEEQVSLYKNLTGGEEFKNKLRKAVYLISIGGTDYAKLCEENDNVTPPEMRDFVNAVIQQLIADIQEIYRTGGRKFAFQDVAPIGCSPTMKYYKSLTEGCYEKANIIAKLHNMALRKALHNLTESHEYQDIKYGVFDYYNQLLLRIMNATNYGFMESEIACCGYGGKVNGYYCGKTISYFLCTNPSAFVFFDGGHPTQASNSQLAKLMWVGDQTIMAPYNLQQLFQTHDHDEDHDDY